MPPTALPTRLSRLPRIPTPAPPPPMPPMACPQITLPPPPRRACKVSPSNPRPATLPATRPPSTTRPRCPSSGSMSFKTAPMFPRPAPEAMPPSPVPHRRTRSSAASPTGPMTTPPKSISTPPARGFIGISPMPTIARKQESLEMPMPVSKFWATRSPFRFRMNSSGSLGIRLSPP